MVLLEDDMLASIFWGIVWLVLWFWALAFVFGWISLLKIVFYGIS